MDNSINFKGAFIIKKPTIGIRRSLSPLLGDNNRIVKNFANKGDILYVVENSQDQRIADFIQTSNVKGFQYIPGIIPDNTIESIVKSLSSAISTKKDLARHFGMIVEIFLPKKQSAYAKKTKIALGLNPKSIIKRAEDGKLHVLDNKGNSIAWMTPPAENGINYAYLEPPITKNGKSEQKAKRVALKDGEIIFQYNTPTGQQQFNSNAEAAIEYNFIRNVMRRLG